MGGWRVALGMLSVSVLAGCGRAAHSGTIGRIATARKSADGARQTVVTFFIDVQSGRYDDACAMYTHATRAFVDRYFGGCVHNLEGLHTLAAAQRAKGLPDIVQQTIQRAQNAHFSVSGDTATTSDMGRPGTVTTLLYADGRWLLDTPAT